MAYDLHGYEKLANIIGRRMGVTFQESSHGGWYSNVENGVIYYDAEDLKNLNEDAIIGILIHESAHLRLTPLKLKMEKLSPIAKDYPHHVNCLLQLAENWRIETQIIKYYKNAGKYFKAAYDSYKMDIFALTDPSRETTPIEVLMIYLTKLFYGDRDDIDKAIAGITNKKKWNLKKFKDIFPKVEAILNEFKQIEVDKSLDLNKIKHPFKDKFQELVTICRPFFDDELENKRKQEMMALQMILDTIGDFIEMASKIRGKNSSHGHGYYEHTKASMAISYDTILGEVRGWINFLRNKFRVILQEHNTPQFSGHYISGKLRFDKLYKQRLGRYNLFSRREPNIEVKYAFSLLVDVSGSMEGQSLREAIKSSVLVGETLRKLNIPFEVICFDDNTHQIKKFGDGYSKSKMMQMFDLCGGGTNDVDALKKAIKNIGTQEGKKIIFVMSDGCGYAEQIRNTIRSANSKDIDVVGVYIGDPQDGFPYPDKVIVQNFAELPTTMGSLLKRYIK